MQVQEGGGQHWACSVGPRTAGHPGPRSQRAGELALEAHMVSRAAADSTRMKEMPVPVQPVTRTAPGPDSSCGPSVAEPCTGREDYFCYVLITPI